MLIVKNKRYMKKHVVGGAGIFDTISNFFKKFISSKAIESAKTVGKELATSAISSAISTAKDLAIEKGKRLIDKTFKKVLTPNNAEVTPNNSQTVIEQHANQFAKQLTGLEPNLTQRSKDILASLINSNTEATNINKLMMGNGNSAIRIEDLVRKMNGSGLRLA